MRFLHRQGCKARIVHEIIKFFPNFDVLISPFFGTGIIEFQFLGKIRHILANDLDENIYNLYLQRIFHMKTYRM